MVAFRGLVALGITLPLAVLATVVVVDAVLGRDVVLSAGYAIAALLAATIASVRATAAIAAAAAALVGISGIWNHDLGTQEWTIRLALTIVLGAAAVGLARIRTQRELELQDMTLIAETAQRALLRSLPTAVGSVGLAARYISATRAALMGGDLYEVAETPYGVRAIVGDVRGKGLDAVQLAATVLAAFRRSVFTQADLSDVAAELDGIVASVAGEEDFVTAVLAEFHPNGTVGLVNCGHHPPVLVTPVDLVPISTGEPQLPLGLGSVPELVTTSWPRESRLLLFTDGLVETRDQRGEFFPLEEHDDALRTGTLDEALDRLLERLREYAGGGLSDDIALVLAEQTVPANGTRPSQ